MTEPRGRHRNEYDPATLTVIYSTLESVLRCFGHAREHVTIIGGLTPTLLIPPPAFDVHVGTADIDLCLTVALAEGETGYYDEIGPALYAAGFRQRKDPTKSFRWERQGVVVDFLYPAATGEKVLQKARRGEEWETAAQTSLGENFAALAVGYSHLISTTRREVRFTATLEGAEVPEAKVFVVGPAGLAALKADALIHRQKPKDAYDLIWTLDNFGPERAARDTLYRTRDHPEAQAELLGASIALGETFAPGRTGPVWYANFMATPGGERGQHETDQQFAVATVHAFLGTLTSEEK